MKIPKQINIICIIVFILTLLLRINYANQKVGFHIDEVLSINISHRSEYLWTVPLPLDKFYSGKELKTMVLFNDNSLKDALYDIKGMHKYSQDKPHTNLYYTFLRLSFIGADNTNAENIVWQGVSLNLVFFILSFFIMYKILNILFIDKTLIPFGLFVAFANTGSISNTLFIRPYQMQECFFLLLTYIFIILYKDIENKRLISVKNFFITSLTIALTLLTGYLAPIYIGLLLTILIIYSIKTKQYKNIYFLIGITITSLLFAVIGYLSYFKAFNCYISKKAINDVTNFVFNLRLTIKGYIEALTPYLFYLPCLCILAIAKADQIFNKVDKSSLKLSKYLLLVSFTATFLIMLFVPFKILRYVMSLFPILSITYPYCIDNLKRKYFYISIFSLLFLVLSITPQKTDNISDFAISKLQNLYVYTKSFNKELIANSSCTVVLPPDKSILFQTIPHLLNEQTYYIYSSKEDNMKFDSFYTINTNEFKQHLDIKKPVFGWETKLKKNKT